MAGIPRALVVAIAALFLGACDRGILVGADAVDAACSLEAGPDAALASLPIPWSSGFENTFGDWDLCYVLNGGTFPAVVASPSPVHSGSHAAAFTVTTNQGAASTSRCKKVGVLPAVAYYGAWYFIPAPVTNRDNWNLLHFRGTEGPADNCVQNLWDVSLINDVDGGLSTSVYDFLRARPLAARSSVPVNQWFHLVVFLRRAADATGQFSLYVDGQMVLDQPGIATDNASWAEWHVGNLATALSPAVNTVYVDDVTISATGP